jgi:hypothetical protein
MRMVAGAILVHAAAVVFAARWIGKVMQNAAVTGSPEAGIVTIAAVALGATGLLIVAWGAAADRRS